MGRNNILTGPLFRIGKIIIPAVLISATIYYSDRLIPFKFTPLEKLKPLEKKAFVPKEKPTTKATSVTKKTVRGLYSYGNAPIIYKETIVLKNTNEFYQSRKIFSPNTEVLIELKGKETHFYTDGPNSNSDLFGLNKPKIWPVQKKGSLYFKARKLPSTLILSELDVANMKFTEEINITGKYDYEWSVKHFPPNTKIKIAILGPSVQGPFYRNMRILNENKTYTVVTKELTQLCFQRISKTGHIKITEQ